MPKAAGLAESIKKKTGKEVDLIPGAGGIFLVMDGTREIFSRTKAGRFPAEEEILKALGA